MAEFGENLKRVREEKGITQQTLAEQLYVTRQAISRWEGGSRYPDLMTAKKMAQYLGVSLDDLLSDDDMKLYVEKSAIMDSLVAKRLQIAMIALTLMCTLIHVSFYMIENLLPDGIMISSPTELTKSVLMAMILGYALYAAITDKLTPKVTMYLAVIFFGAGLWSAVICLFHADDTFPLHSLAIASVLNILFLAVCIRFFGSSKKTKPMLIYVLTGIYLANGLFNYIASLFSYGPEIPMDVGSDIAMLDLIGFLNGSLLLGLLVVMAYVLSRKRKLAIR